MANLSNLSNDTRQDMCNALVAVLNKGSGAGKCKLYTTGKSTLLATITFNDPAFGSASSTGVATVSSTPSAPTGTAVADGVAAVAVFTDSDDNAKYDGTVTVTGGGGAVTLASLTIANGATVTITGGTFTMPAA